MKGSRKSKEPKEFTEWIERDLEKIGRFPSYRSMPSDVRGAVIRRLLREQRGLCAYCGRQLNIEDIKTFHIDHLRPQGRYHDRRVDYKNFLLSCNFRIAGKKIPKSIRNTCGFHKDDWFSEDFHVAPDYPDCTQRFDFHFNGEIQPKRLDDAGAKNMIDKLNLNHRELKYGREELLAAVFDGKLKLEDLWEEGRKIAKDFTHAAYESEGKIMP